MISDKVIKVGEFHTVHKLNESLGNLGYEKVLKVENPGEFSILGDTIRIFSANSQSPVVLNFFGDQVEKIFVYDLTTGRKTKDEKRLTVYPNKVILSDGSVLFPGNYVVHEDHGIGLFRRISYKKVGKENITYFEVEYYNGDLLYVPNHQLAKLSKYIGIGKRKPKLSRLGSNAWKKNYSKVYDDIIKVAKELLTIYAKRKVVKKTPRIINNEWNKKAEESFNFSKTPDQNKAIEAVFKDLSDSIPMDRLLCGDVGFGKTEVALRAAVQTAANGYQTVILVPTTILCEQHFSTFQERLKDLPIKIGRLSRFVSLADRLEIAKKTKDGAIDILIGTHSILHQGIDFKRLGLLVIDEEQKFGVKDKEKIKKFREQIDVISLTATPIPRTLFMALSGLRDISLINSVPLGRKSVDTKVKLYDRQTVLEYIGRELKRNGQVYYLHNQVATILPIKKQLEKEFPNETIKIAHGQLGEIELANIMREFAEQKIDILVCSTIIENGLDLPNVNTLIADESDKFGLSQLYQIRGRIGRSERQAYALFTYKNNAITNGATKRLKAIAENTELGTGYNIAVEDLELRGGGNILGKQQHGSMETIGLILYSKLLSQAVDRLKTKVV